VTDTLTLDASFVDHAPGFAVWSWLLRSVVDVPEE
jgi:hypothetical protein